MNKHLPVLYIIALSIRIDRSLGDEDISTNNSSSVLNKEDNYNNEKLNISLINNEIQKNIFENDGSGNYFFEFESKGENSGDFRHSAKGELEKNEHNIQTVSGHYSYKLKNSVVNVSYTADENGYHPKVMWSIVPQFSSRFPSLEPVGPGAPSQTKSGISSALLGTLIGSG